MPRFLNQLLLIKLNLTLLPTPLAVCRLPADATVPEGILDAPFCAVTRTEDELSIVVSEPAADASWRVEKEWRGLKVAGPLAFDMVGVVAAISNPLAIAGIPIFIISTFDTDYLLVKAENLDTAMAILEGEGHVFSAKL